MIVTGIGSRPKNLPSEKGEIATWIVDLVKEVGDVAKKNNWTLRSGAADGMDTLFEDAWGLSKEIFLPFENFNGRVPGVDGAILVEDPMVLDQAALIASKIHPVWKRLKKPAKELHTRNVFQALGAELNRPSDFCVFYAPVDEKGEVEGGTRTAVEICKSHHIPTYNLRNTDDVDALRAFLTKWK